MGRVSGATVVATQTGAEGFFSKEFWVRTRVTLKGRGFGYFPIRVILEVVVVIGKKDRDEGELESLAEPMRGSRDSNEDFVIVSRGEVNISFDIMGGASSDHTATFSCLDRVIIASGG